MYSRVLGWIRNNHEIKVYDVFNDENELLALKVVDLSDDEVKEQLMSEIYYLKLLKESDKVINMVDYEVKKDVQGLPFYVDEQTQGKLLFE